MSKGLPAPLPPHSRVGSYRILSLLARGGWGFVYRAEGPAGLVAIKEYLPHGCVTRAAGRLQCVINAEAQAAFDRGLSGFVREAKYLSMLSIPGVVKMLELVREHGTAYLVMEYLEGRTLHACIESARHDRKASTIDAPPPLQASDLRLVAMDLLRTLHALHQRGLLHLDIKSGNVMLCDDSRVVLMDFGSARQMAPLASSHEQEAKEQHDETIVDEVNETWAYTPGFSPPELERSRRCAVGGANAIGPWSDLYALAACVKQAMMGFKESAHNPLCAQWVEAIEACLQADHRLRPASALQLLQQLQGSF